MRYSGTVFRLAQSSLAAPFSFQTHACKPEIAPVIHNTQRASANHRPDQCLPKFFRLTPCLAGGLTWGHENKPLSTLAHKGPWHRDLLCARRHGRRCVLVGRSAGGAIRAGLRRAERVSATPAREPCRFDGCRSVAGTSLGRIARELKRLGDDFLWGVDRVSTEGVALWDERVCEPYSPVSIYEPAVV